MLKLIIGRSKSGKTDEMLRLMKKSHNSIYIVPEQYSFAAEKKITASFGMSGMGNPSVYSFRRLAYYMEELYGGTNHADITPSGRLMVLGDIVRKLSGSLTLFGGVARRGEMANQSAVIVTTFKQYGISHWKLCNAIEKTKSPLLKKKLSDCLMISDAYDKFLEEGYRDSEDLLAGLKRNIAKTEFFKDRDIFIDSFQAFTPLEYDVIAQLLTKSRSVTVSLCIGDGGDEFATARRSMERLIKLCGENGVTVAPIYTAEGGMYTATDELKALEESFFCDVVYEEKTDRIHIHRAQSEYGEAVKAAMEVERLCRDHGYRYRDIVIVARDMADYERELSRAFNNFNIPLFIDKKTPLSGEAAAVFMLNAIKIISKGWKNTDIFGYMKTAFSPIEPKEADELENYCLAAGVKARDWKRDEDWDMAASVKEEAVDAGYLERINLARRKLTEPLINLEKKIKGKHTGRELAVAFYEFLEECGLEEKINRTASRLAEKGEGEAALRMGQIYELMIDILESFDGAFREKQLSADEFFSILSNGIESVEVGVIPATTDSVCCGSIDRARGHGAKAVIIIGAAEGKFPCVPKETGIFTNADREELSGYGIELPPDTFGKADMEESLVYSALTCATDRLFVSYSAGKDGANESSIIKRLKKVFPNAEITDEFCDNEPLSHIGSARGTYEDFVVEYARMRNGESVSGAWMTAFDYYTNSPEWKDKVREIKKHTSYENKTELIREELIRSRYQDAIDTSVSRLEEYVKCPFSYFASVTLGLKERKELEVTAADSGTFLHEFVDMFGKGICEDGKTWRDIDKEYIDQKTEEITINLISGLNKHLLETSPRVRNLFLQLKRIAKRSIIALSEHMKKGTFEPLGYEIVFDKNGTFKPLTIDLPNGMKASLRGRIDRADILETDKGKFVRIIDYKSGEKKFSLSDIYNGFDLQLAIYLTTICEEGDYRPAGMLYFKIDEPVVDIGDVRDDAAYERAVMKSLKMDGLVLEDEEILLAMDKSFAQGSDVIPVGKNKDGSFSKNSKIASEGEFAALSKHVKNTVRRLCNEILAGHSAVSPVKDACKWCKMKAFCGFDTSVKGYGYREEEKLNDRDALLKMIEESKEEES